MNCKLFEARARWKVYCCTFHPVPKAIAVVRLCEQAIGGIFQQKFIRAEVVAYDKLIEAGSFGKAREKGWVRTEGKEYIVQDGDVIEFLI